MIGLILNNTIDTTKLSYEFGRSNKEYLNIFNTISDIEDKNYVYDILHKNYNMSLKEARVVYDFYNNLANSEVDMNRIPDDVTEVKVFNKQNTVPVMNKVEMVLPNDIDIIADLSNKWGSFMKLVKGTGNYKCDVI